MPFSTDPWWSGKPRWGQRLSSACRRPCSYTTRMGWRRPLTTFMRLRFSSSNVPTRMKSSAFFDSWRDFGLRSVIIPPFRAGEEASPHRLSSNVHITPTGETAPQQEQVLQAIRSGIVCARTASVVRFRPRRGEWRTDTKTDRRGKAGTGRDLSDLVWIVIPAHAGIQGFRLCLLLLLDYCR